MSGVLYHLFSPLSGLATARGLLRNGGLMIVETAAVKTNEPAMYWNSAARFKGEAYFFPSVACLDYFARFLHMEIIDCAYFDWWTLDGLPTVRVALTCRAVPEAPGHPEDNFMKGTFHTETDIAEHLDWNRCRSTLPRVYCNVQEWHQLRDQPLPFRALRRATRKAGLKGVSNWIDDAIGYRRLSYFQRRDCQSLDLAKYCKRAKQQDVTERKTQLWLSDLS
jgi:hypothetical protein